MKDETPNEIALADEIEIESPEQIFKAIREFYPGSHEGAPNTITELADRDIALILRLSMLKQFYEGCGQPTQFIENLAVEFMKLRISRKRLSRKEFFNAISRIDPTSRSDGWLRRHSKR